MTREQPALAFLYQAIATHRDARLAEPRPAGPPRVSIAPDQLAALTMPVLCLAGEEDVVALPAALEALARRCPNGRFAVGRGGINHGFERPVRRVAGDV